MFSKPWIVAAVMRSWAVGLGTGTPRALTESCRPRYSFLPRGEVLDSRIKLGNMIPMSSLPSSHKPRPSRSPNRQNPHSHSLQLFIHSRADSSLQYKRENHFKWLSCSLYLSRRAFRLETLHGPVWSLNSVGFIVLKVLIAASPQPSS